MDQEILSQARSLVDTWKHLGKLECYEQVDAHFESDGVYRYEEEMDEAIYEVFGAY